MDISLPAVGKVRWKKFHILTSSASFAMPLWCLHLSGALVLCVKIEEAICSKALKVCIGMARLN